VPALFHQLADTTGPASPVLGETIETFLKLADPELAGPELAGLDLAGRLGHVLHIGRSHKTIRPFSVIL
jgi:hypothetical protein